jgi:hypothetical protein
MHHDVCHVRLRVADVVLEATCELVGFRQPGVTPGDDGDKHHKPSVGVQQAELAGRAASAVDDQLRDPLPLDLVGHSGLIARCPRPLERLKMGMDVLDPRVGTNLSLYTLGNVVRIGERHIRLELEVQRHTRSAIMLVDGDIVNVADERLSERGGQGKVAEVEIVAARLEVHDHVAVGQRFPHRRLDPVGCTVPSDSGLAGRDRNDRISEVASS